MTGIKGFPKLKFSRKSGGSKPTSSSSSTTDLQGDSTSRITDPNLKTRTSGSKMFSGVRTFLKKSGANEAAVKSVEPKKTVVVKEAEPVPVPMPKGAVLHPGKSVPEMLAKDQVLYKSGESWANSFIDALLTLDFPEFHAVFGRRKTVDAEAIRVVLAKKMIEELTGPDAGTSVTRSALDEVAQWPGGADDRDFSPDAAAQNLLLEKFEAEPRYLELFSGLENAHKKQVLEVLKNKNWSDAMARLLPELVASMTGLQLRILTPRDGGVQDVAYGDPDAKTLTLAGIDIAYQPVVERHKGELPPIDRGTQVTHPGKRIQDLMRPGESRGPVTPDGNCAFQSLFDLKLPEVTERFALPGKALSVQHLRTGMAELLIMMLVEHNALSAEEKSKVESGDDEVLFKGLDAVSVGDPRAFDDDALKAFIGHELKDCVNAADFASLTPAQRAHVASVATDGDWMHELGDVQPLLFAKMTGLQVRVLNESEVVKEGVLIPSVTESFWGQEGAPVASFYLQGDHYQPILKGLPVPKKAPSLSGSVKSVEAAAPVAGGPAPGAELGTGPTQVSPEVLVPDEKPAEASGESGVQAKPASSITRKSSEEDKAVSGSRGPVPGFTQGMFTKRSEYADFPAWLTSNDFRPGEKLEGPDARFDAFLGLRMPEITAAFGTDAQQMRTRLAAWLVDECTAANARGCRPQDAQRGSVMRWMGAAPDVPRSAEAQAALAQAALDDGRRQKFERLPPRQQAHVAALLDRGEPPGAVIGGLLPQAVATLSKLSVQVLEHAADENDDKAMRRQIFGNHSSKRATVAVDELGACRSVSLFKKTDRHAAKKEVRDMGDGRQQHFGVPLQQVIGRDHGVVAVKPDGNSVFESLRRMPQLEALLAGAGGELPSAQEIGRTLLPSRAIERLIAFNQLPDDEQASVMAKDPLMARLNRDQGTQVDMAKPRLEHLEALSIVMPKDLEALSKQREQGPVPFGQLPLHQWGPVLDLVNDLLIKDASRPAFLESVSQVLGLRLRVLSEEGQGVQDGQLVRAVDESVHGPATDPGGEVLPEAVLVLRPDPRYADPVLPKVSIAKEDRPRTPASSSAQDTA